MSLSDDKENFTNHPIKILHFLLAKLILSTKIKWVWKKATFSDVRLDPCNSPKFRSQWKNINVYVLETVKFFCFDLFRLMFSFWCFVNRSHNQQWWETTYSQLVLWSLSWWCSGTLMVPGSKPQTLTCILPSYLLAPIFPFLLFTIKLSSDFITDQVPSLPPPQISKE